jgi:hypothetical protein
MAGRTGSVVVAFACVAVALAAPSARASSTVVIRVRSIEVSRSHSDSAPKGPSKGDEVLLRDRLVNISRQFGRPAGATVGGDYGRFVLLSSKTFEMQGVARLPGGTLTIQGLGNGAPGPNLPLVVTGGTGRYAGARGTLVIGRDIPSTNTSRLTLPVTA